MNAAATLQGWWAGLAAAVRARLPGRSADASGGPLPVRAHVDVAGTRAVRLSAFDTQLVAVVAALVAFGVVMVYSASIALPDNPRFSGITQGFFLKKHLLAITVAFVAALVTVQLPMSFWEKNAPWVFLVTLVLLVAVLMPFIGKVVNNARRWIPLGFMNFQPSELAKLAIALYAASYMVRRMDVRENFWRAVTPMVVAVVFVGALLLRQPDMGAFIVIATIAMGILFLGGVNARMFFLIAVVMLLVLGLFLAFDDLRRERILAYLDPWNPKYAQGKGYQLTHSLIAVVIGAFFWLTRRIVGIGRQAIALDRVFAGLMCQGIGIWIGFQSFINMGVNLGVLPTKGLTLPLMSYGGSAILMNAVALALVLRVDIENRALMRGGRA
jgi:cell division protein FtsW